MIGYDVQDRIDAYLRGEMSASERAAFVKELSGNEELRKEFEFTKRVANSICDRERKKEQIRSWNGDGKRNLVYLYSITSIAALFVIGFFVFRNSPSDEIPLTIGDNSSLAYSEKYYTFTEISNMIADEQFSVALSYIEKAEQKESQSWGEQMEDSVELMTESSYDLKWLKVQALIGLHRKREAYTLLEFMMKYSGKYRKSADSLWVVLHSSEELE